jgi:aminocarboxymuconate-semialdehyde decarboxylase
MATSGSVSRTYEGSIYFGEDNVMYGTDYPCWDLEICLRLLAEIEMTPVVRQKIFPHNAVRVLGLQLRTEAAA